MSRADTARINRMSDIEASGIAGRKTAQFRADQLDVSKGRLDEVIRSNLADEEIRRNTSGRGSASVSPSGIHHR